jgi:predicted esterase
MVPVKVDWRIALLLAAAAPRLLVAQDDVADVPAQDLRADDDQNKRYFLIGAREGAPAPEEGFGLVVVLPGGDGSADFHPFVKRIYKHAVPEGYLAAQPVAVKWSAGQQIVWPTAGSRVTGMKFTTEELVSAVIEDVSRRHTVNASRVFTLSWSSSGPAAYAVSLADEKVTGSFVAMSVFKPAQLPSLNKANGRAYYLYHSPEDRVCPFRFAEQAARSLEQNGGQVELARYQGGHGWKGNVYADIRAGITWLEERGRNREP